MTNSKGFTLVEMLGILISVTLITVYVWNITKFVDCDFASSYKCEAIHGIGVVVPPSAIVVVWFDSDKVISK